MDERERLNACAEVARTCLCFNLRRAARMVTQLFDGVLRSSGLRITQFSLMVAISLKGPAVVQELAEVLGMDRTTLTRNLKGLEEGGMVASAVGADRRSRLISLTPKGQRALHDTLPLWRQAQEQAVEVLGEERLGYLMPVLHHISASSTKAISNPS
jgi:DNA-binding MarR family transcriptional regulator